eukprot:3890740-Amphidinium_carterae.2
MCSVRTSTRTVGVLQALIAPNFTGIRWNLGSLLAPMEGGGSILLGARIGKATRGRENVPGNSNRIRKRMCELCCSVLVAVFEFVEIKFASIVMQMAA